VSIVIDGRSAGTARLCEELSKGVLAVGFLLCYQPQKSDPALGRSVENIPKEIDGLREALKALKARFEAYVSAGPVVLVDFGSTLARAVRLLRQEPSFFSRALLMTDDASAWSATQSTLFAARGGERIALVCGTDECERHGVSQARLAKRGGVAIEVQRSNLNQGEGIALAMKSLPWLVEGDARFRKQAP
jgi:hypothetical protein